jgi:serine phosphatase RsbU (regulator of sigma subunit)
MKLPAIKLPFHLSPPRREFRKPVSSNLPALQTGSLAALYRAARIGGDFFDFLTARDRLVFALLDIAGKRDEAMDIAASVQDAFHRLGAEIFHQSPLNEADALSDLTIEINRTIMHAADGVHCSPAFVGCYDEHVGTVFYVNAGHTPALVRDADSIRLLAANGLPLGLFSHSTHDAQALVLEPGAALVLVSKGLVETRAKRHEFGIEGVRASLGSSSFSTASELCSAILTAAQEFSGSAGSDNDMTALALMRSRSAVFASSASAAAAAK